MAVKAEVLNFNRLISKLGKLQQKAAREGKARLRVGYSAPYALKVHEDLDAFHPVGEAKFLEKPARLYRDVMASIVRKAVQQKKKPLADALLEAGLFLKEESQEIVPVDTGFLRGSAFAWIEDR